eukprot:SAG31_NODE_873_length_11325_cov_34.061197_3_plen_92_part_00
MEGHATRDGGGGGDAAAAARAGGRSHLWTRELQIYGEMWDRKSRKCHATGSFVVYMAIILVVGCGVVGGLFYWRRQAAKKSEEGGKEEAAG